MNGLPNYFPVGENHAHTSCLQSGKRSPLHQGETWMRTKPHDSMTYMIYDPQAFGRNQFHGSLQTQVALLLQNIYGSRHAS